MTATATAIGAALSSLTGAAAAADTYADIGAISAETQGAFGVLDHLLVSAVVLGLGHDLVVPNLNSATGFNFHNIFETFTDEAVFEPAAGERTDFISVQTDSRFVPELPSGGFSSNRLHIAFTEPVTDPVIHITGLEAAIWDFTPTTRDIEILANDGELDLTLVPLGVISDADPDNIADHPGPGPGGPFDGSIRILGTFRRITVNLSQSVERDDNYSFQISKATIVPCVDACPADLNGDDDATILDLLQYVDSWLTGCD